MTITKKQPTFRAALFDLDDTLYRIPQVSENVKNRIQDYVSSKLAVPADEVEDLCLKLYQEHGTTLAGLLAIGYDIDFVEWHSFVHGTLDYNLILPDAAMRETVCSMEIPRYVFTNADRCHTYKVLDRLGLSDCFQDIICFESINEHRTQLDDKHVGQVLCKPDPLCYEVAMRQIGLHSTSEVIFMDDSVRNIIAANKLGFFTVLVGRNDPGAHICVEKLPDLHTSFSDIFDNPVLVPYVNEVQVPA